MRHITYIRDFGREIIALIYLSCERTLDLGSPNKYKILNNNMAVNTSFVVYLHLCVFKKPRTQNGFR